MRFPRWMSLDWLLPFKPEEPESAHAAYAEAEHRSQRLWLIDNRQESLRAEMQQLTTERMRLER